MKYKFVAKFSKHLSSLFKKKRLITEMSALDSVEIDPVEVERQSEPTLSDVSLADVVKKPKRTPKRVLYFSDGTIEEYDTDDTDEDATALDGVELPFRKAKDSGLEAEPPAEAKNLSWPAWVKHFTVASGSKTLHAMDRLGEGLAYYLGITTPKYQYEIDEYYRAKEEELAAKKQEDTELQSWASPPRTAESEAEAPIVSQAQVVTDNPKTVDA